MQPFISPSKQYYVVDIRQCVYLKMPSGTVIDFESDKVTSEIYNPLVAQFSGPYKTVTKSDDTLDVLNEAQDWY